MCCPPPHNPKYMVFSINKEELTMLFGNTIFVVREKVAEELRSVSHTKGLKPIPLLPMSECKRQNYRISVKECLIRFELSIVYATFFRS